MNIVEQALAEYKKAMLTQKKHDLAVSHAYLAGYEAAAMLISAISQDTQVNNDEKSARFRTVYEALLDAKSGWCAKHDKFYDEIQRRN